MVLRNGDLAELLSREAARHTEHRQRALRRAARAALWRWPEEAAAVRERGDPLTTLPLVGPWIAHQLGQWLSEDREPPDRPPLRAGFLTLSEVRATLASRPAWTRAYRGDLQVHTTWSDGAATMAEMTAAAAARGYDYVGIRILRSIEMNLSPDGIGDMDPAFLGELDLVVAAFHSKLRVPGDETARFLRAVANPF